MEAFLRITRYPYEEPYHLNLMVSASNGCQSGSLEIFCAADDLGEAAKVLTIFPRHSTDAFLWELGSEYPEDRFAFYFRFHVFALNSGGGCAIHLRFNNNLELPDRAVTDFCVKAETTKVNLLGELFSDFARLKHEELWWNTKAGGLDDELVREWASSRPLG